MEVEYGFILITDDEIARALTNEAKEAAITLMQNDLRTYLTSMGVQSTFKGWIAHICPENVKIDKRLEMPKSEWHAIWNRGIMDYNGTATYTDSLEKQTNKKRKLAPF
jgi:hypothetical protein